MGHAAYPRVASVFFQDTDIPLEFWAPYMGSREDASPICVCLKTGYPQIILFIIVLSSYSPWINGNSKKNTSCIYIYRVFPLKPPFITYFPFQILGYPPFWTLSQFSHRCRARIQVRFDEEMTLKEDYVSWHRPGHGIWRGKIRGKIMEQSDMERWWNHGRIDMGIPSGELT